MPKLNQLNCGESYRNVGTAGCVLEPKNIAGALLFTAPISFTPDQLSGDFLDVLQNMAWSDNGATRMFPIPGAVGLTDNSGDPVTETLDNGQVLFIRDNPYNWTIRYLDGGLCKQSALRTLNSQTRWLLFWDADNVIYGFNDNGKLGAIPTTFYAHGWKPATGSTAAQYTYSLSFAPKWINESLGYYQADFDPATITGLQDVQIVQNTFVPATGVANVFAQTYCGGTNLYDTYSTQLAVVGAWKAINAEKGTDITISTVTKDTVNHSFIVTLSAADPDYPDGGTVNLKLAAPSVLAGLHVEGYDSLPAKLEVPSS